MRPSRPRLVRHEALRLLRWPNLSIQMLHPMRKLPSSVRELMDAEHIGRVRGVAREAAARVWVRRRHARPASAARSDPGSRRAACSIHADAGPSLGRRSTKMSAGRYMQTSIA